MCHRLSHLICDANEMTADTELSLVESVVVFVNDVERLQFRDFLLNVLHKRSPIRTPQMKMASSPMTVVMMSPMFPPVFDDGISEGSIFDLYLFSRHSKQFIENELF